MTERARIQDGVARALARTPVNTATQFGRVVTVAAGADWHTLRQLEALIHARFPAHHDTQAAISARLRDVSPARCGLIKEVRITRPKNKNVYQYRLIPAAPTATPVSLPPEFVACPQCDKRCRDFTPEAEFIGWHGECVECFLTRTSP